jgi:hypothetical protein
MRFKNYIAGLESRLYTAGKLLEENPESLVWLEQYGTERTQRHLSNDARLVFQLPSGKLEIQLGSRRGTESVQISSPDGRLLVYPEISNEIGVRVGRIGGGE